MPNRGKTPLSDAEKDFMSGVGGNLRTLFEQKGYCITSFAKKVGLSRTTISGIASGDREFKASYFKKFADALEVPVTALMPENGQHPAPDP